jgi:DNA-binding transcriptional ArsR family regulator
MDKGFLQSCLTQGMSLDQIGILANRAPSTVSYHLKKHGLKPVGHDAHSPNGRLDQDKLRTLVHEGIPIRKMAEELGVGYSTVRHWLKRLGLTTALQDRRAELRALRVAGMPERMIRFCPEHGMTQFFLRPERKSYRCFACHNEAVANRRRAIKRQLVEEAGGACVLCGYDTSPAALHFHHVDPVKKEFGLSRAGVTRSMDKARAEAMKCVLLCSNCHAEVEAGVTLLPPGIRPLKSAPSLAVQD